MFQHDPTGRYASGPPLNRPQNPDPDCHAIGACPKCWGRAGYKARAAIRAAKTEVL